MRDPFFGHRDAFTGDPIRDRDEWTEWDFALVAAFQLVQDLTDKHGLLRHETESERVMVDAVKKIDKFEASRDNKTKGGRKGYKPAAGEYFVPELSLRWGDWPTVEEFFAAEAEKAENDAVQ